MKISPRLLATTSTLATSLFLSGIAYAAPGDPIINDGGSAKGEMVQGSRSVGSDDQKTVYTNYYTEGGAGSGGGAGLGGVFFVDQNAKLTLRNVEMLSNSVKGGEGGSVGFVSLSDLNINLPTLSINADPIQVLGVTPTISVADNGDLVITGAKMGGANSVIGVGAGVSFGTLAAGGKIATIDGSDVTFATPVTVASSAIKQAVIDTAQYSAIPTGTKGKDTLALNGSLSMSDIQQGMVVVGAGIAAGTTITDVVYDADKKVTSVKLSTAVTANVTDFKVVTVRSFDAARFQQVGSDTIKPMGVLPGLMAGMTVTGEGIPDGTTIKSVESDGTIVFSNTVAPTAGFKAGTTGAAVGSAILNLSSERSDLAVGMAVSGDGIPNGTKITAIDGNAITLSNAVTSAAAAKIEDNTFVASFGRVLSNSGNTLQLASVDGVKIGALLSGTGVPANAVVTGIDSASKTVSYRINPSAAQLSTGGAMNGLAAIGTIGSGGSNGKNGSSFNAALSNGEGQPGLSGGKAGAGRGSAGGAGGNGGSGSSGMPFNTDLNRAITALTIDAINDTAEAAASFSSWSFAMAFVKVGQVVKDWVEVGITAAQLGKWVTDLNNGTVALGGNGGVGGAGGAGDTFYGGGAGGKGGNGGSGARSYTEGGTGGDGGAGGDGGFGAGGGAGGSAGHGGRTGNAPDGADGSGGRAGFGGGVGTSGDGTGGGGGSGFGGAIFVRKGGTLLIAGDALFRNNAALSGSSNNNGVAGNAAGSDLFMMRDSNVTLSPGQGRTIRFEGSIGDDSAATYRNAAYAAGAGASLQVTGGGLVQLAGTNTYSGTTYIGGATVQATDGVGIHRDSHITFNGGGTIGTLTEENGGTWLTSGIINRRVGSLPHQISWAGSGGFAAGDDGLVLNFGALDGATGQTLNWNANGFVTAGSTLLFGSTYGTGEVKLINAVDLNGLTGRIAVYDNAAVSTDHAVLAGRFSNGSLIVNDTGYTGTAYFTAQNSLNALTVNNGLVSTKWNGTVGRMMDAVAGGALTVNGGTVDLYGAEKMTDVAVKEKGTLIARDALTARTVETSGKVRVEGAATIDTLKLTAGGQAMFAGGYTGNDIVNAGELTLSGASNIDKVTNVPGAWLVQDGALSATSHIDNAGIWALGGTLTAPVVVQNGLMLVMGTIADQVETAATRTIHTQQFSGNAGSNVGLGGLNGTTANTLVIDQSGDSQYAGIFTGAGNLAKDGTGTLTLTGHNDFTGTLKVSAGTLDTTGGGTFANSVAITVDALATLKIGTDDDIAMLKNAGITHIQAMWGMTGLENSGTLDLIGTLKVADKAANAATGAIGVAQGAKASFGQFANAGKTKVAGTLAVAGGATNDASGMIDIAAAASATFRQLANAGALDNAGTLLVSGQLHNQAGGVALLMPGASNQAGTLVNEGMIQAASALTVLGDYVQNAGSLSTTASLDTGSLSGTGGAIKLGATNRFTVIQSHDGAYAGTIGGAQASMVKQGDAVLSLTGQPGSFSVASLTVEKGGVVVTGTDSFGAVDGADAYTQLTVAQPAGFTAQGRIRTGDVTNAGQALFQGDARTQGFLNQASGTVWTQGATSATGVDNEGRWYLGGDLTAPTVVQNGTMTVTGAIADNTETVATRTIHTAMFSGNAAGVVGLGGIGGTLGHTLVIDQSGDSRYAGIFTGAGNLVKTGAGNLNLTGANSATGTLTVANGTLDTTGGGTFADVVAATVDAPATLVIGTDDTILSLANAGTTRITAASTMAALNNTGRVDVSGGLTVTTGVANLTTGGIGIASGAKALLAQVGNAGSIDNAGALTVIGGLANASTGTIRLAAGASNQAGTLVNEGVIQAVSALTVLGDYVQNAGSLSTTASLDTGSLSGTGGAITLGSTNRFTVIQSHDGAYAGTIGGAQASMVKQGDAVLSLTGQPGSFSVASLTVEKGGVVVTGTDSFGAVDGADTYTQLTVAQPAGFTAQRRIRTGDVTNAGQALFQGDVKAATVANQASGTVATLGNIAAGSVANDGRWSLGGDMTAAQLVQNGMLTLTGPLANGVEVASARTIKVARFGGAATGVVSLGGASGTTVHSLTLDQSDAGLYAGTFQGAGNLIKTGAGALTLTGKNGFTGTLKVSGGTIDTTGGGTFADSLVVTVDAPAALVIGTDDMIGTLANAGATRITAASTMASLGNTGQVAVEGGLTVTGQTSNAATGTVTIAQGASGRFAQIANAGTLSNAGSLRVDGLVDNSFVGTMLLAGGASSRFGSLTNAGSIQANGALTVDGAYVQNAGTLSAGADLATGSLSGQGGTIALTNGAGYALNQTVDGRYAGSITGTGSTLVKTGAGTLTLNGQAGSFATGTLLIRVGTVAVDGAGILGQALKVDIAKEAGLTLVRGDQTISNLTGSGTLALNGNNLTLANGGTFFGTVTGTGNVRLTTGAFELTNSIDAQRGTFEVLADSTMNVKATGTLTAPTIAVIGRMNVEGSATATTTTVSNGGILHLGEASTGKAGSLATTTLTVASGGQLTGNGSVTGTTTIGGTSSGMVRPGNSPGTMTFANLTLDAQSGAVMEIEGAAGAGLSAAQGGYDHITVTGTLTLKPGSTLVLANSTGFQPALGQAINIFGVKPGAVSGMFGTATSAFRNAVAFNLSTGNVVGLGANADQFVTRVARTPNAQAMIDQLRVNRTGGVDQYRGGRLIEQVAGALATGNDRAVRDSFDRASPEVYAGLVEHQKLSMLNNTVELGGYGALRDRAVYVTGSIGHDQVKSAADADYIRFKSQDRRFNLGVAAEIPQAKVQVSYGSVNGRVTSAYMNGKARGDQFGVGVSAPVAADGALRIMGRFSHGDYDLTGTRVTNAGLASFGTVKGKATVYGGGVEYFTLGKRTSLDASVELLQVLSKVRSFGETGVDALTALSVRAQRDNVTVLRARLTAGYMVRPNWQGFARIGVDHELSEALPGVTANVISEDAAFTVRAKGLPNTRLRVGLGTQVDLNPRMAWRLEGDVGNSSTYGVKTSIALRF